MKTMFNPEGSHHISKSLPEETSSEISAAEREMITKVENLPIDLFDRMTLLLVWKGIKPSSLFSFVVRSPDGSQPLSLPEKQVRVENVLNPIRSLGLVATHVSSAPTYDGSPFLYEHCIAASYEAAANRLQVALTKRHGNDEHVDQHALGVALGFPETAAIAYEQYDSVIREHKEKMRNGIYEQNPPLRSDYLMEDKDLPVEIQQAEWFQTISRFALSKDHWKEEIETIRSWANEIKRLSPKLYKEAVEQEDLLVEEVAPIAPRPLMPVAKK